MMLDASLKGTWRYSASFCAPAPYMTEYTILFVFSRSTDPVPPSQCPASSWNMSLPLRNACKVNKGLSYCSALIYKFLILSNLEKYQDREYSREEINANTYLQKSIVFRVVSKHSEFYLLKVCSEECKPFPGFKYCS